MSPPEDSNIQKISPKALVEKLLRQCGYKNASAEGRFMRATRRAGADEHRWAAATERLLTAYLKNYEEIVVIFAPNSQEPGAIHPQYLEELTKYRDRLLTTEVEKLTRAWPQPWQDRFRPRITKAINAWIRQHVGDVGQVLMKRDEQEHPGPFLVIESSDITPQPGTSGQDLGLAPRVQTGEERRGDESADAQAEGAVKAMGTAQGRAAVDAFLLKCNEEDVPRRITRTDIWRAAGYKRSRQFEYWQAWHPKATAQDRLNFSRILSMKPADFVMLLKKKRLI